MQDNFQEKLNSAGKVNLEKFAELERKMTDVGDSIRKRPLLSSTSSASTSEVPSDIEEKISLGNGVLCSKAAYNKLVHVEESHADWAYALLKGVFGDKAHRMRVRISEKYTENERFPTNFLMVAKSLHRDWLGKQKIKDKNGQLHLKYSATEVEKYVNELPAYLADRAYDMQGPRGANARKESGNHNAPERRRSGSTELKRKYRKRGQSLLEMQQFQKLPHPQQPSIQQPLPSQKQQPPHQEPPFQQQLSQTSLQQYQSLDSSDITLSIPEAVAMTVENFETTATTFTTL